MEQSSIALLQHYTTRLMATQSILTPQNPGKLEGRTPPALFSITTWLQPGESRSSLGWIFIGRWRMAISGTGHYTPLRGCMEEKL